MMIEITSMYYNGCVWFTQVIMGDRPAAERACKEPNPIIDGRKANVNLAILGAKPRGNLQPGKIILFPWTDYPSSPRSFEVHRSKH
jgi:hypothetical protein